jgi:hypothetical protein
MWKSVEQSNDEERERNRNKGVWFHVYYNKIRGKITIIRMERGCEYDHNPENFVTYEEFFTEKDAQQWCIANQTACEDFVRLRQNSVFDFS